MEIDVEFTRESIDSVRQMIASMSDVDVKPAFHRVVDDFEQGERELFASAGASEDLEWPPISARTLERHPDHKGPMRQTDTLYDSLTERDARYAVRDITEDDVTVGSTDPVINLHQHKQFPGARNPRRQTIAVSTARGDKWIGYVADAVLGEGVSVDSLGI